MGDLAFSTDNLQDEAAKHFDKLKQSLEYHTGKLENPQTPKGVKYQVEREVNALKFVMEYAKEALSQRGITV